MQVNDSHGVGGMIGTLSTPLPLPHYLVGRGCGHGSCCVNGSYQYTMDLLALASRLPLAWCPIPPRLAGIVTPLRLHAWRDHLSHHPDPAYTGYILDGIAHGFRIGYQREGHQLVPASRNTQSAYEHPEVVSDYLRKECSAVRVLGPWERGQLPKVVQISRFGVIPKKQELLRGGLSWTCPTQKAPVSTTGSPPFSVR